MQFFALDPVLLGVIIYIAFIMVWQIGDEESNRDG